MHTMTDILLWSAAAVGQKGPPAGPAPKTASDNGPFTVDQVIPPQLTDISDLSQWWQHVREFFLTKGVEFATHLVEALVIFIVGRWVARFLTRLISRIATQAKVDQTLVKFIGNLSYAATLAFVALSALNRIGIDTTSFAAVVAAAGLAVGFALQGSLANFAAGVMLIMFKPFRVGATVTAGGSTGTVDEIQIFNTLLKAADNSRVIVPNSSITNSTITNFSIEKMRRIDLVIKCSYEDDLRAVKRFLVETLYAHDRILQLPPPNVAVDQLGDNAVSFLVQPWVRSEDFALVRAELLESIKVGFALRGFRQIHPASPAPKVA